MDRKIFSILLITFITLVAILSFYIKIPYNINTRGIVYPLKEWTLSKNSNGNLIYVLKNNRTNSITQYSVKEFIRGDVCEFILNNDIFSKKHIKKDDTIGYILSNEDNFRLLDLECKLTAEEAMLEIYASGQKPEEIAYYKELAELTSVELETQKKLFERVSQLYNEGLIAKNDYDIALNELKVKEQNYRIAQSSLVSVKTGAKEEQLNMSKNLIISYQDQIEQLKQKLKANIVKAPFDGVIVKQKKGNVDANGNIIDIEDIVKIVDISSLLVVLPIEFYEYEYLKRGTTVEFYINGQKTTKIEGKIIDIDNTVQILKRRQVVFVTVEITEHVDEMFFNMFVDGTINCGKISVSEYFFRLLETVTEN